MLVRSAAALRSRLRTINIQVGSSRWRMELKPAGKTKSKDRDSSRTGPKSALFSGLQPLSVEGPLMCERLQELAGSDKCCARVMPTPRAIRRTQVGLGRRQQTATRDAFSSKLGKPAPSWNHTVATEGNNQTPGLRQIGWSR